MSLAFSHLPKRPRGQGEVSPILKRATDSNLEPQWNVSANNLIMEAVGAQGEQVWVDFSANVHEFGHRFYLQFDTPLGSSSMFYRDRVVDDMLDRIFIDFGLRGLPTNLASRPCVPFSLLFPFLFCRGVFGRSLAPFWFNVDCFCYLFAFVLSSRSSRSAHKSAKNLQSQTPTSAILHTRATRGTLPQALPFIDI